MFLIIDAPHVISHTRRYDWDYPVLGRRDTTITYMLESIEGGTRVTVRHEGFAACAQAARDHADGWERVFGWLNEYAAAALGR